MAMIHRPLRDATGKSADERFAAIRAFFLAQLALHGMTRDLYSRPKPGDSREPTEEELVRRDAEDLNVSVNDICIGIQRAFDSGAIVRSYRFCRPHIIARVKELRESQAGLGPDPAAYGARMKPEAIERARKRGLIE